MAIASTLWKLRNWDQRRDSVPGEHWAAFGTGLTVLQWGLRRRSPLLKAVGVVAAGVMLVRGVTGRDGVLARLKRPSAQPPAQPAAGPSARPSTPTTGT